MGENFSIETVSKRHCEIINHSSPGASVSAVRKTYLGGVLILAARHDQGRGPDSFDERGIFVAVVHSAVSGNVQRRDRVPGTEVRNPL